MLPAEDVPCPAPPVVVAPLMAAVPMVRSKDTCCRRRLTSESAECNSANAEALRSTNFQTKTHDAEPTATCRKCLRSL